ncbi:hypothetical protein GUJ93_ZPchr0005g15711 [Zizania palustris]|uniref:Uncharacterized protein n=1 Tax=Zizania palustris TaxID=103762 RepID=A0A8J5VRI7_ZIZPA|nr:hypothetical protein GUJ93_ZPchr0005g15711 [Zizania palustris]
MPRDVALRLDRSFPVDRRVTPEPRPHRTCLPSPSRRPVARDAVSGLYLQIAPARMDRDAESRTLLGAVASVSLLGAVASVSLLDVVGHQLNFSIYEFALDCCAGSLLRASRIVAAIMRHPC